LVKRYIVKAIIILSFIGLAACDTTSDLGVEFTEITEEESDLVFYGPGLQGGFRRIISGKVPKDDEEKTIAFYGPALGKTPYAEIHHNRITRHNSYFNNIPLDSFAENLMAEIKETSNIPPTLFEKDTAINKLGNIHYLTYLDGDETCISFFQIYGNYGSSKDRLIAGSYYDEGTVGFNLSQIKYILSMIGDKKVNTPFKPQSWLVKKSSPNLTGERSFKILLNFIWTEVGAVHSVPLIIKRSQISQNIFETPFQFKHHILGNCTGINYMNDNIFDKYEQMKATWRIDCGETTATGEYIVSQEITLSQTNNKEANTFNSINQIIVGKGNGLDNIQRDIIVYVTFEDNIQLKGN